MGDVRNEVVTRLKGCNRQLSKKYINVMSASFQILIYSYADGILYEFM